MEIVTEGYNIQRWCERLKSRLLKIYCTFCEESWKVNSFE